MTVALCLTASSVLCQVQTPISHTLTVKDSGHTQLASANAHMKYFDVEGIHGKAGLDRVVPRQHMLCAVLHIVTTVDCHVNYLPVKLTCKIQTLNTH